MHCVANGSEEQKERKNKKRKKMMMKSSSVLFASLNSKYFEDYSILNYSNHVQSDNKDFSCALGSTVANCTCPPSSAGIGHRKATEIFIKDLLEDEQGLSMGGNVGAP